MHAVVFSVSIVFYDGNDLVCVYDSNEFSCLYRDSSGV